MRLVEVDVATLMCRDGKPRPDIYLSDGMCLNAASYALWNPIVAKKLVELYASSPP